MPNPEIPYYSYRNEVIRGNWMSFNIYNPHDVIELARNGEVDFHDTFKDECLPDNMTSFNFGASQEKSGNFDYLEAKAEFEINPMSMLHNRDWQDTIISELVNSTRIMGGEYLKFVQSPHEVGVGYVQIDDLLSLRVQVATEYINGAVLDINNVRTDELKRLLPHIFRDDNLADDRMLVVREPYDNIRHTLAVFNRSVDIMMSAVTSRKDRVRPARQPLALHIAPYSTPAILPPQNQTPEDSELPDVSNHGFTETFHQIGGAYQAKSRLKEIAFAIKNPDLAKEAGLQPNHFLLYGPPGSGKTSLIRAFVNEIDGHLIEVDSTDIGVKWIHQSAENMKKVFKKARSVKTDRPVVIFIDEFDSIGVSGRIHSTEDVEVKNILKQELSKTNGSDSNIIFVSATNAEISSIDSALTRPGRLETIYVDAPNKDELVEIWFNTYSQPYFDIERRFDDQKEIDLADIDKQRFNFNELASLMAELQMTGAHVVEAVRIARASKMSAAIAMGNVSELSPEDRLLTQKDLLNAIEQIRKR